MMTRQRPQWKSWSMPVAIALEIRGCGVNSIRGIGETAIAIPI